MLENKSPLSNGTIITTTKENVKGWTAHASAQRRWGLRAEIIDCSLTDKGWCYKVKHDDGLHAWYDPSEFHICMLAVLHRIEKALPNLLKDDSIWNSVRVDYHPPVVDRVCTQFENYRISLHKIYPCEQGEALFHPHPWPSAMKILSGRYSMLVGYGEGEITPPIAAKLILNRDTEYEMTDPNSWHSVRPLDEPSYSLLVTGPPWERWAPKSDKQLNGLSSEYYEDIMRQFRWVYK